MTPSIITDPLQMWRKAISTLETGGNALANKTMNSKDFAGALHQITNVSLGMQQTFEKVLGVYFKKLNLPSRKDITELTAMLQRIEGKLDELAGGKPAAAAPPRPARTRRPAVAAATDAVAKAPAKRARKKAR